MKSLAAACAVIFINSNVAAKISLPAPEGPYPVGYARIVFSTDNEDALSPERNDKRKLLLEIFYPAKEGGIPKPYATAFIGKALSEAFPFKDGFDGDISTHSASGAPAADGVFPAVVFSQGLSWPVTLYQSLTEDLASRGFIVIAVNHPHVSSIDYGGGVTRNRQHWPKIDDEVKRQKMLAEQVIDVAEDLRDTVTEIESWTRPSDENPVSGHIDSSRLGAAGHSYGGTAVGMITGDERIKAVVAMEGRPRNNDDDIVVVEKPFLHLIGGYNRLELEGRAYRPSPGAPVYQAVINGTGHAYFSDLIYLYRNYADADWLQRHRYETDPERVIQITRDYLGAFFDHYLRDEMESVLLREASYADRVDSSSAAGYPEVELSITVE